MLFSNQEPIKNFEEEIESQQFVSNETNNEAGHFVIPVQFEIVGNTSHLFTEEDFQRINVSRLGNF